MVCLPPTAGSTLGYFFFLFSFLPLPLRLLLLFFNTHLALPPLPLALIAPLLFLCYISPSLSLPTASFFPSLLFRHARFSRVLCFLLVPLVSSPCVLSVATCPARVLFFRQMGMTSEGIGLPSCTFSLGPCLATSLLHTNHSF